MSQRGFRWTGSGLGVRRGRAFTYNDLVDVVRALADGVEAVSRLWDSEVWVAGMVLCLLSGGIWCDVETSC